MDNLFPELQELILSIVGYTTMRSLNNHYLILANDLRMRQSSPFHITNKLISKYLNTEPEQIAFIIIEKVKNHKVQCAFILNRKMYSRPVDNRFYMACSNFECNDDSSNCRCSRNLVAQKFIYKQMNSLNYDSTDFTFLPTIHLIKDIASKHPLSNNSSFYLKLANFTIRYYLDLSKQYDLEYSYICALLRGIGINPTNNIIPNNSLTLCYLQYI